MEATSPSARLQPCQVVNFLSSLAYVGIHTRQKEAGKKENDSDNHIHTHKQLFKQRLLC